MGSSIGDVMLGGNIKKDNLLFEYEKLIDRLIRAEKWASDNNYSWDYVKANKYNTWKAREDIIKDIKVVREDLGLPN